MNNPKVSIIMPTYKGCDIIKRSINSLLSQTYDNIEIIIVDDNGIDTEDQINTLQTVKEYLTDDRIKYIAHTTNKNGSCARNTGIKNSSGEFICFLDDDDCFERDKIALQLELFKRSDESLGLVYTGLKEVYPNGVIVERRPLDSNCFQLDYLKGKIFVCSSSIMVRRKFIDQIGGWDESFSRHQDMEFIVRLSDISCVKYIPDSLVIKYREDRNIPYDPIIAEKYRLYFLDKMEKFIKKYNNVEQKNIYFFHYLQIGKNFLKQKKLKRALIYTFKSKKPIKMLAICIIDALKYRKRRS